MRQTIRLSIVVLGLFLVLFVQGQEYDKRILFVGNSFIYFYNLPQVVQAMGEAQGHSWYVRHSTVGGSNLEQHWKEERETQTQTLLKEGNWDYVIFNNHSTSAIETPESFMTYGRKFAELVKQQGGQPIFLMTWAYGSNPLMLAPIRAKYEELAKATGAQLLPGGILFDGIRTHRPDLPLFFDDKHPTYHGTYALGLLTLKHLTGQPISDDIGHRISTTDRNGDKLYLIFTLPADAAFLQDLVNQMSYEQP